MKPVHLTLAGLQSYREKQEVDFLRLSDAGVFGIFGPTGSGKSSILDAITLALYGKVERAPGGTQGIINQVENVCTVSFTFELNGAGGSERYRVERQYKRTGDVSANQSMSRLIRLENGGQTVLADKAKDVDNRVQEILGLSMQDFTRAVVLPQGKFAEFLSLKGVERRHMLERLFHLESYGDALGARVSARLRETDMAVKRAEAEQLGLGDASAEALEAAALRLSEAEAAFQRQRTALEAAEREAEERRRLWKLEQEKAQLTEDGRILEEREPEMAALQERLRLSVSAGRVGHFLNEWDAARLAMEEADSRLLAAQSAYAETQAAYAARQADYQAAKEALEQQEEPLQRQIESLKRSLELHAEIRSLGQETVERTAREASLRAAGEEAEAAALKEQQQLQKGQALQSELKLRLAALELPGGRREELQEARMGLQKTEHLRSQLREAETELREAAAKLEPVRAEAAGLEARSEELGREDALLRESGLALHGSITESIRAAEALQMACGLAEAEERRQEQERYRAALAANLAAALADGEPCPVCGSSHHPVPAVHKGSAGPSEAGSVRTEEWKQLQNTAAGKVLALKQLLGTMTGDWSRMEEPAGQTELESAFREAAAASALEPSALRYEDAAVLAASMEDREEQLRRQAGEWSQRVREAGSAKQVHQNRRAELGAKRAAMESALQAQEAKTKTQRQQLEQHQTEWSRRYPDRSEDTLQEEWEKLQGILREQEELRSRLDKAEPYLTAQQEKLNRLKEDSYRLERELVQAATERREREALLEQKQMRLTAELGEPLSEEETRSRWSLAGDRLLQLKRAEEEGRQHIGRLQETLLQISTGLAAAQQAQTSCRSALERAEANGRRELAEAGFGSGEEARAALLTPEAAVRYEEQVRLHRERMLEIRTRLQRLESDLAGKTVTEEAWRSGEDRLAAERQKHEEDLAAKAKAERDMEELQEKHARWELLEKERAEAQTVLTRLQKLQSVLRGNAFVEFMAEEQLSQVSRAASERLGQLTRRRYALETDSNGGFVIRDDANGGLKRPVSTLSGGETFLTSLSLALALSAQIQLNGKYPLEFFFLDEGFGTLDPDLLETVVHALEKLHMEQLTVGVISHVPELKSRLPRRLVVASSSTGTGSQIRFESL
ncbi:AAA family ATPase [Gorillibacterium sp. sgz5001074]|uniref:AAA family ATPase n=1 Tax=Gorillibacterium sp. sgz5001074 TaxID=3446695 RepID=UPI003F66EAA7